MLTVIPLPAYITWADEVGSPPRDRLRIGYLCWQSNWSYRGHVARAGERV